MLLDPVSEIAPPVPDTSLRDSDELRTISCKAPGLKGLFRHFEKLRCLPLHIEFIRIQIHDLQSQTLQILPYDFRSRHGTSITFLHPSCGTIFPYGHWTGRINNPLAL